MAFEYLDETNSSKAKQQKYSQLREELLDLKASLDLFDSDNLKKLTKKTDSFKQYCISIRNITLPLRTKERNELKLQHRYERLQHLINLAQETFDKIDMLNIKDKISPKDLNAYYDAYQEEKELLERAKSNKKELRKHKVFRNAKKKLISKSQPVNSQIKELIKIQNRLALKDKE